MAYRDYWHCPKCKGNYDHGEKCDCTIKNKEDLEDERFTDSCKPTTGHHHNQL